MISPDFYTSYKEALLSGNRQHCRGMVNELLQQDTPVREIYESLFQRSMYEVGTLWESNKITVATEHMCTAITEGLINICYPLIFSARHTGKKAVVTCTPGEYHQLGARMVADFFEMNGWDGYFTGADIPQEELLRFILNQQPDVVAISMSIYFNMPKLVLLVRQIQKQFPGLPVIVGGQAFRWVDDISFFNSRNVMVMNSLKDLETFLMKI